MLNLKKRKKKSNSSNTVRKSLFKIVAVLLLVAINLTGLSRVSGTRAYFNDYAEVSNIIATAGSLDFAVSSLIDFSSPVTPSQNITKSITIGNEGSLDFQYVINSINFSSSSDLCGDLMLNAKLDGNSIYTGKLTDFVAPTTTLATSMSAVLDLELFLSNSNNELKNQTCNFDFNITGWQTDFSSASQGFSHSEVIANLVSSGDWSNEETPAPNPTPVIAGDVVINEIMWMGSKPDSGSNETSDEWIELRNMTNHEIDIGQWRIENVKNHGNDLMIPASKSIPANGYFLIANNPQNSANTLINVLVDEVNSSMEILNQYNNNGVITLKDDADNIIDQTPLTETSNWPAGLNNADQKWSMERNLTPGDGSIIGSWHTCDRSIMSPSDLVLMQSYWQDNAQNYNCGTPKNSNLSKNDSTAVDYELNAILIVTGSDLEIINTTVSSPVEENIDEGQEAVEPIESDSISDSDSLPADTSENAPVVPAIESDKTSVAEPESVVDLAPLAPTDSAPGPDPIPPSV